MSRKVRLELCPNSGKGRGKVQHVILSPLTLDSIRQMSCNKFKKNGKLAGQVRLFSTNKVEGFAEGTEITSENLQQLFNNMHVTVALKGEDFIYKDGRLTGASKQTKLEDAKQLNFPEPPVKFQFSDDQETEQEEGEGDTENSRSEETSRETGDQTEKKQTKDTLKEGVVDINELEMEGEFPVLEGNVLEAVRESIKGAEIFFEKKGDGYIAFDYKSLFHVPAETFPDPNEANKKSKERKIRSIRRECRGLLLCERTGHVIARRFHKFFNLNEKNETKLPEDFVLPEDSLILEKVDGSLVTPVVIPSKSENKLFWLTKTAFIPELDRFVENAAEQLLKYSEFSSHWIAEGYTPLFEWCDSSRVVGQIKYEKSSLTLIAIRHRTRGCYLPFSQLLETSQTFNIPLVQHYPLSHFISSSDARITIKHITDFLQNQHDREGFVIYIPSSPSSKDAQPLIIKLKTLWYVSLASASKSSGLKGKNLLIEILKNRPSLLGVPPQVVWSSCFSEASDDIISAAASILIKNNLENHANYLKYFYKSSGELFFQLVHKMKSWACDTSNIIKNSSSQKEAQSSAVVLAESFGWSMQLTTLFLKANFDQASAELLKKIRILAKKNYSLLENLLNLHWNIENPDFSYKNESEISKEAAPDKKDEMLDATPAVVSAVNQQNDNIEIEKAEVTVIPLGKFDKASDKLKSFVLEKYLPRKVCNYLGIAKNQLSEETEIKIPSNYKSQEGKIKGMWEQFEKEGIIDLRVDVQPPHPAGFTDHFGDENYCHWQVQFGASKVSKRSSRAKRGCERVGAFAGLLIETDRKFTFQQMVDAMEVSFNNQKCVILGKLPEKYKNIQSTTVNEIEETNTEELQTNQDQPSEWQIYCDLDGVLVDFDKGAFELLGRNTSDVTEDYLWKRIMSAGDFFAKLEPYSYYKEMWEFLCSLSDKKPIILSGLPTGKFAKKVKKHKQEWCSKYLGDGIQVITCMSSEKHTYSGKGKILIDDRIMLRNAWITAGGEFIYHKNFDKTKWLLNKLFNPTTWNLPILEECKEIFCPIENENIPTEGENANKFFQAEEVIFVQGNEGVDKLIAEAKEATIVGFDAEWRPDEFIDRVKYSREYHSGIAIVQLAFSSKIAFVIDMININPVIMEIIQSIFKSSTIVKIGYGLEQDIDRLNMNLTLEPIIDLQNLIPFLIPFSNETANKSKLPLQNAVKRILKMEINKSKKLQASDWEERPLSAEQIQYAGTDAAVLVKIYEELNKIQSISEILRFLQEGVEIKKKKRRIFSSLSENKNKNEKLEEKKNENDKGIQTGAETSLEQTIKNSSIKIYYSGIFLDKSSQEKLLKKFPAKFSKIRSDHVTLAYKPAESYFYTIENLPVGEPADVFLYSESFSDEGVHCVPVLINHPSQIPATPHSILNNYEKTRELIVNKQQQLHITIATSPSTPPSASNQLLASKEFDFAAGVEFGEENKLTGVFGMLISMKEKVDVENEVSQLNLPQKIKDKIENLLLFGQIGENIRFKPEELSAAERHILHEFSESVGFQSRSEGKADRRRLIITKAKNNEKEERNKHSNVELLKVTSPELFYLILNQVKNEKENIQQKREETSEFDGYFDKQTIQLLRKGEMHSNKEQEIAKLKSILENSMEETDFYVIVLRGLPGSGKSELSKILMNSNQRESIKKAKVSADDFFYRGAGIYSKKQMKDKTAEEIYQETFRLDLLAKAHEFSRSSFLEAVQERANMIIVDNCNSKKADFSFYVEKGEENNYEVIILEIPCPSFASLKTFQGRGLHKLSFKDLNQIQSRWESVSSSILLDSSGSFNVNTNQSSTIDDKNPSPLDSNEAISFQRWLSLNHLVHYSKSRPSTHLSMAIGNKSSSFVHIPPSLEQQFYQYYAADIHSPQYLSELCTPVIKMFFDIDFHDNSPLSPEHIDYLIVFIQKSLKQIVSNSPQLRIRREEQENENETFQAIVTGFVPVADSPPIKTGLHVTFPNIFVTLKDAAEIRKTILIQLANESKIKPLTSWENTIDGSVYNLARGLRMFGSRKVGNKKVDQGRVYQLLRVFNSSSEEDKESKFLLSSQLPLLLRKVSIRTEF